MMAMKTLKKVIENMPSKLKVLDLFYSGGLFLGSNRQDLKYWVGLITTLRLLQPLIKISKTVGLMI